MKTIITLLFIFTFSTTHYSQTVFKLDSIHQYSWDNGINDWKHNTRDLYTYDNGGTKETNLLRLNLNGTTWENFYQFNKTYDGDNNLIESILQNWDTDWTNGSQDTYSYNTDNLVETFSYAVFITGNWMIFNVNTYAYDTMGNLIEDASTELDFISMMQINNDRLTYEYTNDLKTTETKEAWRTFLNDWENEERKDYTYNSNNDLSLLEVNAWNIGTMSWGSPYNQTLFTYNASNQATEITDQVFASGSWLNTGRVLNTYEGNNITIIASQTWNSGTLSWDNQTRQVRTFDSNDNLIELVFESWDNGTNDWQGFLRQIFFSSPVESLNVDEQTLSNNILLYPNPAKNQISVKTNISVDTLAIYNLQGQQIRSYKCIKNLQLPLLADGMYFLKIISNGNQVTKPFIIKH